jgi:hypothetical protein
MMVGRPVTDCRRWSLNRLWGGLDARIVGPRVKFAEALRQARPRDKRLPMDRHYQHPRRYQANVLRTIAADVVSGMA